jgi:hypothetical protein
MKKLYILIAATSILFTAACKKDGSAGSSNLVAISFVNATAGSEALVPKFGNINLIYSTVDYSSIVDYGASGLFSWRSGSTTISLTPITDTTHTLFSGNLNLQAGGIYSLYLTGTVARPDTVFM